MQPIVLQSRHSSPRTNHRFAAILESNTPWATLLVGLLAAVGSGFGPARELFVWDRGAILHGEIWRLVTGHLVHAARGHFLWDVLVFLAASMVIESRHPRLLRRALPVWAVGLSVGLMVLKPDLEIYYGLSALCTALFVWLAGIIFGDSLRERRPILSSASILAIIALIGKIIYEASTGQAIFATDLPADIRPLPLAHLLGTLAGVLMLPLSLPSELLGRRKQQVRAK